CVGALHQPTKGLDNFFKVRFAAVLNELSRQGITVLMVSHDVEFCAENAHQVSMFFDGQIITTDTPRRFFGQNSFYTTAANRMSRCVFQNAVTAEDVTWLYRENGGEKG
ncbi:MAG: ABC transporter ATP-binding protein, partial [Oscillospiraceae bacterium]|nr:ABC transporter ATP-binding protein [Oscillospiraceae bacterium]